MDIEDFDDDELREELEERGYYVYDEEIDYDEDEMYDEAYDNVYKCNFILPHWYDSNKLRDHLLDIVGKGHYLTDDELLDLLRKHLKS